MFNFDFSTMIYTVPALLFAVTVHAYAQAQCADSLGDPTPRMLGKLTMNPLAHLDPIGALMLVICRFGWANPVPYDPRYFKDPKAGIIKMSLAGICANLFVCLLAAILAAVMQKMGLLSATVNKFLVWFQLYNVWFGFFNLIPIPPLDGATLLSELLPYDLSRQFNELMGSYGFYILIALVFTGVIGKIITPLAGMYLYFVNGVIRILF